MSAGPHLLLDPRVVAASGDRAVPPASDRRGCRRRARSSRRGPARCTPFGVALEQHRRDRRRHPLPAARRLDLGAQPHVREVERPVQPVAVDAERRLVLERPGGVLGPDPRLGDRLRDRLDGRRATPPRPPRSRRRRRRRRTGRGPGGRSSCPRCSPGGRRGARRRRGQRHGGNGGRTAHVGQRMSAGFRPAATRVIPASGPCGRR